MANKWKQTLEYLGLVEPNGEHAAKEGEAQSPARAEPSNVRRIAPSRGGAHAEAGQATLQAVSSASVHVTNPTTFNEVEEVGERFRGGVPVIVNLAGAPEGVAKRVLDFASGLVYGLEGQIERVGDRVFLLSPAGLEVSTEEREKLSERGFFNQA
jgi:cell division inhibitor SepF